MSIFPFVHAEQIKEEKIEIPLAKEYAYDFQKGDFILKNGKPFLVTGKEALKIWIEKALITSRYKEVIHTWSYGSEFEDKILGRGYTKGLIKSEVERYTKECLYASLSEYITNLKDFVIEFVDEVLKIEFTVETIYGEMNMIV